MKVFSITANRSDYRLFEFSESYDAMARLPVSYGAEPANWHPPIARIVDADKPVADFMAVGNDVIVYRKDMLDNYTGDKAYRNDVPLVDLIAFACFDVQASVTVETKESYPVLMVTECCNALDKNNTVWSQSERGESVIVEKFAFHKAQIGTRSGLFRLADPVLDSRYIFAYTTSDEDNEWDEDSFYDLYMSTGNTGLVFAEVWSSLS